MMKSKRETNCFGLKNGKCKVLKEEKCEGCDCGFYKTKEQYHKDRQKALERLRSLDRATLLNINDTYYRGKMNVLNREEEGL